jgi:hypothetical protein
MFSSSRIPDHLQSVSLTVHFFSVFNKQSILLALWESDSSARFRLVWSLYFFHSLYNPLSIDLMPIKDIYFPFLFDGRLWRLGSCITSRLWPLLRLILVHDEHFWCSAHDNNCYHSKLSMPSKLKLHFILSIQCPWRDFMLDQLLVLTVFSSSIFIFFIVNIQCVHTTKD